MLMVRVLTDCNQQSSHQTVYGVVGVVITAMNLLCFTTLYSDSVNCAFIFYWISLCVECLLLQEMAGNLKWYKVKTGLNIESKTWSLGWGPDNKQPWNKVEKHWYNTTLEQGWKGLYPSYDSSLETYLICYFVSTLKQGCWGWKIQNWFQGESHQKTCCCLPDSGWMDLRL